MFDYTLAHRSTFLVAAFVFLAFLPQFVEAGAGPESAPLFLHGFLVLVVGAFIEPLIIILAANLLNRLRQSTGVLVWMERGLGAMFTGSGVRIALTEQS